MSKFKIGNKIEFHIRTPQFHDVSYGTIVFIPDNFSVVIRWKNGNESTVSTKNTNLCLTKWNKMTIFRNIVEMSNMVNNDEVVFFTDHEVDCKNVKNYVKYSSCFEEPWLRFSRQVLKDEIEAGLNTKYTGDSFKENKPEITQAIDGFYKLLVSLDIYVNKLNVDPGDAVVNYISAYFYDCMSGGCDTYSLAACRYLIKKHNIDLSKEVHPGYGKEDKWSTLKDFLNEIKDIPEINFGKYLSIGNIKGFLGK